MIEEEVKSRLSDYATGQDIDIDNLERTAMLAAKHSGIIEAFNFVLDRDNIKENLIYE